MLEVRNLVFHPLDNGVEKSIIEDISFAVPDGEMLVITRLYWMDRISRNSRLRSVQKRESDLHSSSRHALRE